MSDKQHDLPVCPFCHAESADRIAQFGTAQLVSQYYCHACRSVFEYVKWQKHQGIRS